MIKYLPLIKFVKISSTEILNSFRKTGNFWDLNSQKFLPRKFLLANISSLKVKANLHLNKFEGNANKIQLIASLFCSLAE